jgi:transcriptional regulator with XRE-family HTH domain
MHYLSTNLKLLRKRKGWSQGDLAARYEISRSAISSYELGTAEPNILTLLKMSEDFRVSIDRFVRQDLTKLPEHRLSAIERGVDFDYAGKGLRVLATTVDDEDNERITLVSAKAKAGYTAGYGDPEYLAELPNFRLPFLPGNKTYRAFQISGDSMPPIADGSIVIGSYVDDWNHIKEHERYIVVSKEDGVVLKFVSGNWKEDGDFVFSSSNPIYPPYTFPAREVLELWKFEAVISEKVEALEVESQSEILRKIQADLAELRAEMRRG